MKTIACLIFLVSTFSGCSSTSNVAKIAVNQYTVGSVARGGFKSWAEVKEMALKKANDHCASMGQELISSKTETRGARGWTPQEAWVTFECGAALPTKTIVY